MTHISVIRIVLLLVLFLASGLTGALATPRTALVIGNGAYQNAPLANPPLDARAMADKLRALDFQVIEVVDVDRTGMRTAIRDFAQLLRTRGGVGLFFYAGHGVQVGGDNYLLPVGVDIRQAFEVPDEGLEMSSVLRAMEHAGNDMNVVILDACRNNPFARSFRSAEQGLARMEGPTGSLIAYSTAPGSVAADGDDGNSPYTRRLLEAMDIPGLTLEQVFKRVREGVVAETDGTQVPWEHSSLLGEFYFQPMDAAAPASEVAADTTPTPETAETATAELELAFWESIQDSDDPAYFQAYLDQYPRGNFTSLAKLRLNHLNETVTASRSAAPPAPPMVPETAVATAPTTPTPRPRPAEPAPTAPEAGAHIQRIIQAAQAGDPVAQGLLGRLLATGQGLPQDLQQAYVWSTLAAERGVQDAVLVEEFLAQHLDRQQRRAADRQLAELRAVYHPQASDERDRDRENRRKPKKPKKDRDRDNRDD